MTLTIYHNPRCSKSRQALALIEAKGLTPHIIRYLETGVDLDALKGLMSALGLTEPKDMMRKGESIFKDLNLKEETDANTLLLAMEKNPILLERPIILRDGKGVIGRPPENAEQLF